MTSEPLKTGSAAVADGLARVTVDGLPFVASTVDGLADHIGERAAAG